MTDNQDFQILRMNESPFFKESHHGKYKHGNPQEKVSFYIPKKAHDDLLKYFKANGQNLTDGFNELVSNKLKMINTSKRTIFSQVEFIMIMPKTSSLKELNEKSRIIALYNTETDFFDEFNHENGFNKSFNYQYDLRLFGEGFFRREMSILNSTKESPVRRVNVGDLANFDSLYRRLDELYGLRGNEWAFVRCPLNNYLDVKREGQFQSSRYRGDHEGIYVFDDFNMRLYCHIIWNYSLENKSIGFEVRFISLMEFMDLIYKSDFKPLRESYDKLKNNEYAKEKFKAYFEGQKRFLDFLEDTLNNL